MKIIGITSPGYDELIPSYLFALNKYWDNHPEVIILGYNSKPDFVPHNVQWVDMNAFSGCECYCSCIKAALENITDEILVVSLCKHILIDHVDKTLVEQASNLIINPKFKQIGKIWLDHKSQNNEYYKLHYTSIEDFWVWDNAHQPPNTNCLIPGSNQPSIWNKEFYKQFLPTSGNYLIQEVQGTERYKKNIDLNQNWKVCFHKDKRIFPFADATQKGTAITPERCLRSGYLIKDEDKKLFPPIGWRPGDGFWEGVKNLTF